MELHVRYYDMLQREDEEVVLLLARAVSKDDLTIEKGLEAWGRCPCNKHFDRLLIEVSDVLPEYRAAAPFEEGDNVHEGRMFRVRLAFRKEM